MPLEFSNFRWDLKPRRPHQCWSFCRSHCKTPRHPCLVVVGSDQHFMILSHPHPDHKKKPNKTTCRSVPRSWFVRTQSWDEAPWRPLLEALGLRAQFQWPGNNFDRVPHGTCFSRAAFAGTNHQGDSGGGRRHLPCEIYAFESGPPVNSQTRAGFGV